MTSHLDRRAPVGGLGWAEEEPLARDGGESHGDPPDGLVTLRFIWNAIRRQVRLCLAVAFVGLAVGALVPIALPAPSLASTRILLTHKDGDDPMEAMETDSSLVTTNTVANRVIDKLGLEQTPDELLEQYSTTGLTNRILEISASAPTDAEALRLARTIANTFLEFRMEHIRARQDPIKQKLDHATARVEKLRAKVPEEELIAGTISENDPGPAGKLARAETRATTLRQTVEDLRVDVSLMSSSRVIDPAAIVPHSFLKTLAVDALTGVAAALAVGVGFVVVSVVLSDRVRTRRDIARALGARVTLSIAGEQNTWRPIPRLLGRSRLGQDDLRLAARHLHDRVPWSESMPALAVVGIDSLEATASIVATLVTSVAEEGHRVLLVDITGVLATRLGATEPGTHDVSVGAEGSTVVVHRPEADASPPEGPLLDPEGDDALLAEWVDADLVLTLADLSPELGADHLRTWAAHAAFVVTTGRSTATKIHSVAEMIKLANVRLGPVIVLGADRTDETIGLPVDPVTVPAHGERLEMVGR